jgi:hypothetical protein
MADNNTPTKFIQVKPDVTDPSMRNRRLPKNDTEALLHEMGEDTPDADDVRNTILGGKNKTKEEQNPTNETTETKGMSTLLIVVFALIVIALVALIVWMVVRQNETKDDENEIRTLLHPHPRNMMTTAGYRQGVPPEMMNQRRMAAIQHATQQAPIKQQSPITNAIIAQQQSVKNAKTTTEEEREQREENLVAQQQSRQIENAVKSNPETKNVADNQQNDQKNDQKNDTYDDLVKKTNALMNEDGELLESDRCMLNSFDQEHPVDNETSTD